MPLACVSDLPRVVPLWRLGILVFDGFEPLDVWGFAEAFAIARAIGKGYADATGALFETVLISNEVSKEASSAASGSSPAAVKSWNGPRVAPDCFRDEALDQVFDVLMIPGGMGIRWLLCSVSPEGEQTKRELLDWVRRMDVTVPIMSSVCTGAAVLAAAGVLDGRLATTNRQSFEWVASFGPRVQWDRNSRWVDDGHCVTSAGVSAGTDMGFHLVERLAGSAVAERAVLAAEYDWRF